MHPRPFSPRAATVALFMSLILSAAGRDSPPPPTGALLEAWGLILARESDAAAFGLNETECAAFVRGFELGAQQKAAPHPLDKIYFDVTGFVETHRATVRAAQRRTNLEAAPAYFARLAKQSGVTLRPSGLACEVLRPGAERKPRAGETVTVAYRARLVDGTEFDSTDQMGPVDLALDAMVPGWCEGLQLIGIGGKIRLWLPPALAFSDADALKLGIPPASIVDAELTLVGIKPTPPTEPVPPPAPIPPPPPPGGFTATEILETWGWICTQERGVMQARLDATELAHVEKGLTDALSRRNPEVDAQALYPQVAELVAARMRAYKESMRARRLGENAAFFEKISHQAGIVRRPSGLCYEIVRPGAGAFPRPNQRVRVNYVGRLLDGTIFDRTDPELGPLDIDVSGVIRGWTEGVQLIKPGGLIRLYLPPELAYGDAATSGIPPNSALIFEVELLEIREVPPTTEAP